MANLSNINNILRTGSLGVGINRDPLGAFEISSATKPGVKMFNTASSGKTYEAYSDTNGNYIIYDQDADSNRLTISSAGNATFAGTITSTSTSTNTLAGKLRINGTTTTGLEIASSSGSSSGLKLYNDSSNDHAYILNHYNGNLVLGTNNAAVITLNGTTATFAGNVTTGQSLLVNGVANNSSLTLGANTGNWVFTNVQASRNLEISDSDGTGTVMTIDTSGNSTFAGKVIVGKDSSNALEVFSSGDTEIGFSYATKGNIYAKIIGDVTQASPLGGELAFQTATGGTLAERMRITSGGDVEIQGGDIFLNSGTNYNDKGVVYLSNERTAIISDIVNATANGDTSLDFQTRKGGTRASALFIDQFRNSVFSFSVGIGMTPAADAKLEIADGTFRIRGNQSHSIQLANSSGNTRAALGQAGNEGDLSLYRSSNTKHVYLSSYYNSYINPSNGNLGIGTTSPSEKLHVSGGNVRIDSVSNANHLIIQNNATATSGVFEERIKFLGWNDNENAAIIGIGNAYFGSPVNALAFSVSAVEAMRIKHGGNVNFGKQPGDGNGPHLIVNSFSYTTLMQGTSTANIFVIRNGTGLSANVGMILFESNAGGASGQITTNSSTNTTSYNTSGSDERLKKNITDWNENVLDKFKDIQPKKFHFKTQNDDSDKIKGYIAQNEVDKFPEAYPLVEDKESGEKRYLFNPSGMNVYLMKAIQELKADNDSLKARIETLENK